LRFYDLHSGAEIRRFQTDSVLNRDMADLSADGSLIAYSDLRMRVVGRDFQSQTQGVILIAALTGEVQTMLNVPSAIWGTVRFSPDGNLLLLESTNGTRLWDLTLPGESPGQYQAIFTRDTTSIGGAFSPDSNLLTFNDVKGLGSQLVIYDLLKPQQIFVGDYPESDGSSGTYADLAWTPDGSTIALLVDNARTEQAYRIQLFDVESQTFTLTQEVPEYVDDLTYSPDGSLLAVTVNGRVALYDAATLDLLAELPRSAAWLVEFSADGSMLLTGGWDGIVRVWGVTE